MPANTRVFLIDDHPIVRAGARLAISGMPGFEICGETGTVAGAVEAAQEKRAQLIIADLLLGSPGDGLEFIGALRQALPEARILVFSMNSEDLFADRALRAGAHGYLMKGGDLTQLQEAMRQVQRGEIYLSAGLAKRQIGKRRIGSLTAGPMATLSDREMQVFLLLGAGKSTQQIAHELGVSIKTASAHRENLKAKLNLESAAELVRSAVAYVVGQGHSS